MKRFWLEALSILACASLVSGQQPIGSPAAPDAQSPHVQVFKVGSGVTAPELLPADHSGTFLEECAKTLDGEVELSFLVDAKGEPRNIIFLRPLGSDLDKLALRIVATDRFKPGTRDGAPVVVAEAGSVKMHACLAQVEESAGNKRSFLRLISQPMQDFKPVKSPKEAVLAPVEMNWNESGDFPPIFDCCGHGVDAPVPLVQPEAEFTPEAKKAGINGDCGISLVVDANGLPHDLQVVKSLNPGLDKKAMEAIRKYRFRPAMKDGEPVPVKLFIGVHFRSW
jgi:TonB family protein